jgi:hypothetical protein
MAVKDLTKVKDLTEKEVIQLYEKKFPGSADIKDNNNNIFAAFHKFLIAEEEFIYQKENLKNDPGNILSGYQKELAIQYENLYEAKDKVAGIKNLPGVNKLRAELEAAKKIIEDLPLDKESVNKIIAEIMPKQNHKEKPGIMLKVQPHQERLLALLNQEIDVAKQLASTNFKIDAEEKKLQKPQELNEKGVVEGLNKEAEEAIKDPQSKLSSLVGGKVESENNIKIIHDKLTGKAQKAILEEIAPAARDKLSKEEKEKNPSLAESYEKSFPEQGKRFNADINSLKGKERSLSIGETEKLGKCEKELEAFGKVVEAQKKVDKAKEANKRGETGAAIELDFAKEYLERKQNNLKEAQDIAAGLKNPGYLSLSINWLADKVGQAVGKDAMAKFKSAGDDFKDYANGNNDMEKAWKMALRLLLLMLELLFSQVMRAGKFAYHTAFPIKDRANDSSNPAKGIGAEFKNENQTSLSITKAVAGFDVNGPTTEQVEQGARVGLKINLAEVKNDPLGSPVPVPESSSPAPAPSITMVDPGSENALPKDTPEAKATPRRVNLP